MYFIRICDWNSSKKKKLNKDGERKKNLKKIKNVQLFYIEIPPFKKNYTK
jgi:hypothetical protein